MAKTDPAKAGSMSREHGAAKPQPQWGTETTKRRPGDAAKNQLLLNGLRDVSSKIRAKLREVERQ
jgi:hypothetical protein